jgi:mannose/fructose/N-acetylgalactosamine-specific phosphotransferase system component IID
LSNHVKIYVKKKARAIIILAQYAGQAIKLQPVLDQLMPSLLPLLPSVHAEGWEERGRVK